MNYETFEHQDKKIFLVDMRQEKNKIFSELTHKWIKKYIELWKKIWIIVNKKWYSTWIICEDCGYIPKCENCDIPIAYHLNDNKEYFWICHICKKNYNLTNSCKKCWWTNTNQYWTWTQKIAETIQKEFWKKSIIIESETVNSPNKIKKIFDEIKNNQIIIWTSLLTNPMKNINFDIMIFINADIWLNIPDYQTNYYNFLFLYETFTKHKCWNFIVQTYNPTAYSILNACKMDFEWFNNQEMKYREDFNYPPFTDICIILYKNEIEEKLFKKTNSLYQEIMFLLEKYWIKDIEVYATPPLIYKMFGKYRYNIILKWKNLRQFMDIAYSKLKINSRWFKIDRKAMNIV